jgi:hypothetical protein
MKLRPPLARRARGDLEPRSKRRVGSDRSSNRHLPGGFPGRTDSRISPFLHFQPDSENAHCLFRQDEPLVMKRRVMTVVFLEELGDGCRERKNRGELDPAGKFPAASSNRGSPGVPARKQCPKLRSRPCCGSSALLTEFCSGSEIAHVVEVGNHPRLCCRAPSQPFLR